MRHSLFCFFVTIFLVFAVSCKSDGKYEMEKGTLWGAKTNSKIEGFSGKGYVEFSSYIDGNSKLEVNIEADGEYAVKVNFCNPAKKTWSGVRVDYDGGKYLCSQRLPVSETFTSVYINNPVNFIKGTHEITVARVNEGWLLDSIEIVPLTDEIKNLITPSKKLAIKNPSKKTQALFDYLLSQRGKSILSGQYIYSDMNDINVIEEVTGKYPAIMGIDLIDYSPSRVEHGTRGTVIRKAKAWAKKNGIITCSWHWNAPKDLIDEDRPEMRWYDGFRAKATTFNYVKGLQDKNSEEYALMIRDIDVIAEQLKSLMDSDIPVLWRPLHEAAGGWFWWGARGAENYIELYKLMFDRLVNYHGLNNLIWVWNGQNSDWYPGDEYVDIVAYDTYPGKQTYVTSHKELQIVQSASEKPKLCALSENGTLPDIEALANENSLWGFFCTWNGEFVLKGDSYSSEYTEESVLKKYYANDFVITRDELPKF